MKHTKKGFTLIEVLVVVLMVGILSSIAVPQYRRAVERTRVAEVQTLLRSIYESRERIAWERGADSYKEAKATEPFGFDKLDISVKGKYEGEKKTILRTKNFTYDMSGDDTVTATAIHEPFVGAVVSFNGQAFGCKSNSTDNKACEVWRASSWNDL